MKDLLKQTVLIGLISFAPLCPANAVPVVRDQAPNRHWQQTSGPGQAKPAAAPARWLGLIGEYGPDTGILYILE